MIAGVISDWYIAHIFPIWVNTYGRLTGLFSFSVGEILLCLGVVLTAAAVLLAVVTGFWFLIPACRRRGKKRLLAGAGIFYRIYAWILLGVCLIMTLNCTLLYHGDTFNNRYFAGEGRDTYNLEELLVVRNFVVCRCNELSGQMERDANGDILYMQGYYFPFSMEANYNDVMYLMNKPATLCHELAHLKGYIYEDEANFIGFLACISSEDLVFQYSGYLSVLNYLDNDFYDAMGGDLERYRKR